VKSVTANERHYRALVIGGSSGRLTAFQPILAALPVEFPLAIIVVQHLCANSSGDFVSVLNACTALSLEEAQDKSINTDRSCLYRTGELSSFSRNN
jgi:chemotaxis response regulator CheB